MGLYWIVRRALIAYLHPDGRRVTVSYHTSGETFRRKTLKAMLELQAKWGAEDLKRLKLAK